MMQFHISSWENEPANKLIPSILIKDGNFFIIALKIYD